MTGVVPPTLQVWATIVEGDDDMARAATAIVVTTLVALLASRIERDEDWATDATRRLLDVGDGLTDPVANETDEGLN